MVGGLESRRLCARKEEVEEKAVTSVRGQAIVRDMRHESCGSLRARRVGTGARSMSTITSTRTETATGFPTGGLCSLRQCGWQRGVDLEIDRWWCVGIGLDGGYRGVLVCGRMDRGDRAIAKEVSGGQRKVGCVKKEWCNRDMVLWSLSMRPCSNVSGAGSVLGQVEYWHALRKVAGHSTD